MKKFFIVTLSILLFLFGLSFGSNIDSVVSADEQSTYTSVIYDLWKDDSFLENNYPAVDNDHSLSVITLAESVDNELFVYVYNPSSVDIATSINISIQKDLPKDFVNYKLKLLSQSNTLFKYKVLDFAVTQSDARYYEITSIYRAWIEGVDDAPSQEGQTITEVPFVVGRLFTITGSGDSLKVNSNDIDYIEVTQKFVGYVRYKDGNWWHLWGESACDRHFVAFSTNKQIDQLMEADIYFRSRSAHLRHYLSSLYVDSWDYHEPVESYRHLTNDDSGTYDNGKTYYTWNRIQTMDEFKNSVIYRNVYEGIIFDVTEESVITSEGLKGLAQKQWVLSFYETPYEIKKSVSEENYYSTQVGDVTILRLKFESAGVTYDLGVIDNKQSGSTDPINKVKTTVRLSRLAKIIIAIVVLLLLLPLIIPILPHILKILWFAIKYLAKAIWWLLQKIGLLIKDIFVLPFDVLDES